MNDSFHYYLNRYTSPRMKALCSHLLPDTDTWDIACDHGLIGLWAAYHHHQPKVTFVDQSSQVISRLRKQMNYVPDRLKAKIEIICKDASQLVLPSPPQNLIIAGIGAKAIMNILDKLDLCRGSRLILGPQTQPNPLTDYLTQSGYQIQSQSTISEGQRDRVIICADA